MGEQKVAIPAYVRVGICKECGADVYAPQGGGLPQISACSCPAGSGAARTTAESSNPLAGRPLASGSEKKKAA